MIFIGFVENDEWIFFFDSSKCIHDARAKIVLVNPHGDVLLMSYHLSIDCNNNLLKYEAFI